MTTIAWDGKTLAVDSRMCSGGTLESDDAEKLFLNIGDTRALTSTGLEVNMYLFIEWVANHRVEGAFPKDSEDEGCGIVIELDGTVKKYLYCGNGVPQIERRPFTDGSGWKLALGAMDFGANAVQAVGVAIKRDLHTGGSVQSFTLET